VTRFEASTPGERLGLLVDAVTAHRNRGSEGVLLEAEVEGTSHRIEYADRLVRLEADDDAEERLDDLLDSFPVFKIKQPETRKADSGVVYVSAIADPKHAAEFIEGVFRAVYRADEDYTLRVVRV
jgi:hypothetical protein